MILNDNILNKLSDKIGQDVRTPAGATVLALDPHYTYSTLRSRDTRLVRPRAGSYCKVEALGDIVLKLAK